MAITDFKPQIRQALNNSDSHIENIESAVEMVDQLLDPSIPNSIWNHISVIVLQGEVNKTNELIRKMHLKAVGR
tara:strand:+ start:27993 stop:28214 length:222 start_codon:yes stop_codon:yes gene_type:complete